MCDQRGMATKTTEELQRKIERLVREHIEAQRLAATAAVERAFATAAAPRRSPTARSAPNVRRAATEMADRVERLYAAVRENPGETMTVISAKLDETPQALNRPMFHLKRAGKVRSAGLHQHTRYFPMALSRSA